MAVPKRKVSKSRRDKRSANKKIQPAPVGACPNCTKSSGSHQVCRGCGYYKGRKILETKEERSYRRAQTRESREVRQRAQEAVVEQKDNGSKTE